MGAVSVVVEVSFVFVFVVIERLEVGSVAPTERDGDGNDRDGKEGVGNDAVSAVGVTP